MFHTDRQLSTALITHTGSISLGTLKQSTALPDTGGQWKERQIHFHLVLKGSNYVLISILSK
jgi:hypothetical protein